MANKHTTLSSLFTGIANAIRSKNGSTETIIADNFPAEIENLRTGFDYNNHNIISISDYEFKNCEDIKSVNCYSLTSIGNNAFENCKNLKTVILYDGVESVGENAFKGCDCIIYYKGDGIPDTWNTNWNPDNCIVLYGEPVETWDISATSNDNVTAELCSIDNKYTLFIYGNGDMKDYTIYDTMPWYNYRDNIISTTNIFDGVTSIGSYAFSDCSGLTSINIPNSVTNIGNGAFYNCTNLTSINIPDGVTSIDKYTFYNCSSLTSIIIPDNVTRIGDSAFRNCTNLNSITYTGTTAQWNAITFGIEDVPGAPWYWNSNTGNYTIHCTDGDIAKDGTITYHTTE